MSELKAGAKAAGFSFEPPSGGAAEISSAAHASVPAFSFGSPGLTDSSSTFVFGSGQRSNNDNNRADLAESEAAATGLGNVVEDDCPLCLEPLPPFWDKKRRVTNICCGKAVCRDCGDKGTAFVKRARAEGTFGREEQQLAGFCPLCRTKKPANAACAQKMLQDKFEEGCLPPHFYRDLALIYLKGDNGVEVDVERGMEIVMLGAEKGDPDCQFFLGRAYQKGGFGAPQSLEDAKRWLLAATEQGHAIAEYGLANLLKDEGNNTEFLRHLRGSALKGFNEACYDLGVFHYYGKNGAQKSTEEALEVLTPAAERGHTGCMGLMGYALCCPENGRLEPPPSNRDFTKGMHWLRRAAAMGEDSSISNLEKLEKLASSKCFMCRKEATPEKAFLRCSRCRAAGIAARTARCSTGRRMKVGTRSFASNGMKGGGPPMNWGP